MKKALFLVLSVLLLAAAASAQVPPLLNYQGRVVVGTTNFDGPGQFKFALTNATGSTYYWTSDGTIIGPPGQPANAVSLPVTKGLYSVLLGDSSIPNMTAIPASVFANPDVRLRVFFSDGVNGFQLLSPDQRIAPNPYLADGVVTGAKIAVGAVGSAQLATGAVQSANIAGGAVGSAQIAAGAITNTQIASGAVTGSQIALGTVSATNLLPAIASGLWTASGSNVYRLSGNVGIGTTSPSKPLELALAAAPFTPGSGSVDSSLSLRLTNTATSGSTAAPNVIGLGFGQTATRQAIVGGTFGNDGLDFYVSGNLTTSVVRIDAGGNVGIGTATPGYLLDVAGAGRFSGDLNGVNLSLAGNASVTGNSSVLSNSSVLGSLTVTSRANLNGGARAISITSPQLAVGFDTTHGLQVAAGSADVSLDPLADGTPLRFGRGHTFSNVTFESGNVGVGTTFPTHGKLEVSGTAGVYATGGGSVSVNFNSFSVNAATPGAFPASIYADGVIVSNSQFVVSSDARVKDVIGRSDGARDLETLLGIEVTDYRHRDVLARGPAPTKKVIAQQVERVFPQAVRRQVGEVPDIYRAAPLADGWISLATDLRKGERVKLIAGSAQEVCEVLEVRPGAFRTGFATDAKEVFVYGREVPDFRTVDYDAIAMLNVSATQQVKREKDAEIQVLRDENAALKARLDRQERQLAEQAARDAAVEARLDRLEQTAPVVAPVRVTLTK